jgi:hypothetical protein
MAAPPKGLFGQVPIWPIGAEPVTSGAGQAVFASDDFDGKPIKFRFATGGCSISPPEPNYQTTDLMGSISLTQFYGQRPYRMDIDVQLDGFPDRSVEADIKTLEHFAEVHPGRSEPPILTVDGDIPKPHPNLSWRVQAFTDPVIDYVQGRPTDRCRYFTTVSLIQNVTDRVLVESLRKSTAATKGVQKARKTTVIAGEDFLFEVARRVYRDPSRAADIATANDLHLGKKLTPGQSLWLP